MGRLDVDYDSDNDSLFLYDKRQKSLFSIEYGDFNLDINEHGEVIGLEFDGASKFFYELLKDKEILTSEAKTKAFLKALESCRFDTRKVRHGLILNLLLVSSTAGPISANIPIPQLATKKEIRAMYNRP